LIGMRLADLTKSNRVVRDSGQHDWFVSMGGAGRVRISSLKNVFFYSCEEMQTVLVSFCRVRFLLYASALLLALYDVAAQLQSSTPNGLLGQLAVLMALANVVFFTQRGVAYYRLLALGQRQTWHVVSTTIDSRPMFAAYKRFQSGDEDFYVPYLLATCTPQVA